MSRQCSECKHWFLGEGYAKPEVICNNPRSLRYSEATSMNDVCVQFTKRDNTVKNGENEYEISS